MTYAEAPQPQRGRTLDEQQEQLLAERPPEAEVSDIRRYLRALHPRELVALGNGSPVVVKQLVQLLFALCWPFWAVAGLIVGVIYYGIVYPALWLLFWPVRALLGHKQTAADPGDPTVRT